MIIEAIAQACEQAGYYTTLPATRPCPWASDLQIYARPMWGLYDDHLYLYQIAGYPDRLTLGGYVNRDTRHERTLHASDPDLIPAILAYAQRILRPSQAETTNK